MKQLTWQQESVIRQSLRLWRSFQHWTGKTLLENSSDRAAEIARELFLAPFVLVSHGTEPDPIINYGNQKALDLWELSWEELTQMPSRYTAEPVAKEDRDRILTQTKIQGFVNNYRGVRISSKGQHFLIENGTIWNVLDEQKHICGQAAVFSTYIPLS